MVVHCARTGNRIRQSRARAARQTLSKFRQVDKYESFHEILPSVRHTTDEQKRTVSGILDTCSLALLQEFEQPRKPAVKVLKQLLIECMDALSVAPINAENREFGYQLGWYLAEKVQVNLKKGTEKKLWGYWQVEQEQVLMPLRPRVSAKAREQFQKKKKRPTPNEAVMSS